MRVTSSMYYDSLYGNNNLKLSKELFDVNRQIASGIKIQYASDDIRTFTETMRLDNEVVVLGQIKKSVQSGYKISNQSDSTLNEFDESMNRMRVLLLQASNETNSDVSLDAIAVELRGIEKNLKSLANTSINGQYLFSGSAVDVKPISEDGTYNGNNIAMNAFVGSRNQQQYNVTGSQLFLGEEVLNSREITSNMVNKNLLIDYPALQSSPADSEALSASSTIRNLMGDTDNNVDNVNNKHHFYVRGVKSDGVSFKTKIDMKDTDTIDSLLTNIGNLYGNTPNLKLVNVTMNSSGEIKIEDKQKGSSKLDFHMVGAVDFSGGTAADVTDIDNLDNGETNFAEIINPTTPPAKDLFVKQFSVSGLDLVTARGTPNTTSNIEGLVYDRTDFMKEGSIVSSNVSQILKDTNTSTTPVTYLNENAFAKPSTKISDVADLSKGTADTLAGTSFVLNGKDTSGNAYSATIDFAAYTGAGTGSTFTVGGVQYNIYNMKDPRTAVDADEMTYQQMMDVMNMVVTNTLPASNPGTADEYDNAISTSKSKGDTYLSYDGKIQFGDQLAHQTSAEIAFYDANSDDFSKDASVMAFNANNALTITDPKTDFFKSIDEIVTAVEEYKETPNGSIGTARNPGITNAIRIIDDLQDHVAREHSIVGANSNSLESALGRTELLEISTMSLRSSVIDTDLAESSLHLTQLTLNYEAMLSTVGRISKLSLVNYL